MGLLIFFLFLALFLSFLCSIMEAVLLSTPLSFFKIKEEKGDRSTKGLVDLKKNIDRPLSAILSLNTIAHTIGAAGVGAQATKIYGEAYFGIISAILTLLILIFSEIIPKTLGARYWRKLAVSAGVAVRITIIITYPLVAISALISNLFSKNDSEKSTSREEISALANIGQEEGIFGEKENKIIQNIIKLKSIKVAEIMTPRVVVTQANEDLKLSEFMQNKQYLQFSRVPVFKGDLENITGYVLSQAVFERVTDNQEDLQLKDVKRDIIIVPNGSPLFSVWEKMLNRKEHIAMIIDEYGGMEGIVTMEDIIETLLGFEIVDEKDTVADMQQYARERWKKRQEKYRLLDVHGDNINES